MKKLQKIYAGETSGNLEMFHMIELRVRNRIVKIEEEGENEEDGIGTINDWRVFFI